MSDVPPSSAEGAGGPPRYPSGPPEQPPGDQPQPPAPGYPPPGYPPPGYPPPGYPPPGYPPPGYPPPGGWYGGAGGYGAPSAAYASYGARLGGWLIDFVIIFIVSFIIDLPLNAAGAGRINYATTAHGVVTHHHLSVIAALLQIVIVLLYGAFLCGSVRGQTPGMMAVGVRAVDAESGGPIGFTRGLGRAAFEYLMALVFFLPWVLDMLFPLWDARRQTLHDKVTRTVVIRAAGGPPT